MNIVCNRCLFGKDVSWGCAVKVVGVVSVFKLLNFECFELVECRLKIGWLIIGKVFDIVDRLNGWFLVVLNKCFGREKNIFKVVL